MLVKNLKGKHLDRFVAMANGESVMKHYNNETGKVHGYSLYYASGDTPPIPKYSTDIGPGGRMIEKWAIHYEQVGDQYEAQVLRHPIKGYGRTWLEASMRALVVYKFGPEVNDE